MNDKYSINTALTILEAVYGDDKPFMLNSLSVDELGVPTELKSYIKRSCNKCHGRGCQTLIVKENRQDTRVKKPCQCVDNGYRRMRTKVAENIDKLVSEGLTMEEAKTKAKELFKGLK